MKFYNHLIIANSILLSISLAPNDSNEIINNNNNNDNSKTQTELGGFNV